MSVTISQLAQMYQQDCELLIQDGFAQASELDIIPLEPVDGKTRVLLKNSMGGLHEVLNDITSIKALPDTEEPTEIMFKVDAKEGTYFKTEDVEIKFNSYFGNDHMISSVPRYNLKLVDGRITEEKDDSGFLYNINELASLLRAVEPTLSLVNMQHMVRRMSEYLVKIQLEFPETSDLVAEALSAQ